VGYFFGMRWAGLLVFIAAALGMAASCGGRLDTPCGSCPLGTLCSNGMCVPCGEPGQVCCTGQTALCNDSVCNGTECVPATVDASTFDHQDAPTLDEDNCVRACATAAVCCETCNVAGYSPAAMGAVTRTPGACSPTQIQAFVTACTLSTSTMATCQAFYMANMGTCDACTGTGLEAESKWGWAVCESSNGPCFLNEAGCTDIVLGEESLEKAAGGSGSCGDALNAFDGCQRYACQTCTNEADQAACAQDTEATGMTRQCAQYQAPVSSSTGPCAPLDGASAASSCSPDMNDQGSMIRFITLFCGLGP